MPEQTLKSNLDRIREELADPQHLDEESRRELAEIADTIEHVLEEPAADHAEAHASIQDKALRFEARHPRFSRILSDVTDALAKLGL